MSRSSRLVVAALVAALTVPLLAPAAGAADCPIATVKEGATKQQQYKAARAKAKDAVDTWQSLVRQTAAQKNPAKRQKLADRWAATRRAAQKAVDHQNAVFQINFAWHQGVFANKANGNVCRFVMHTNSNLGGLVPRP